MAAQIPYGILGGPFTLSAVGYVRLRLVHVGHRVAVRARVLF